MFNSVWYNSLLRPPLAPANWIFAPVWGVLYVLIFAALILYIIKKSENKESGYMFFGIQLLLNILWSPVFFAAKNIKIALIIIILLDIFVFLMIKKFYSVSKYSGIILIPYFVWILFATYLNAGYFFLN